MSLLAVEKLTVAFPGQIAVRETSFVIAPGETLALVGKSGCGKSVTAFSVMRLLPPNAKVESGRILFDGTDLLALSPAEMRAVRGKQISLIQQEPMTSLNPVLSIGLQISEVVRRHEKVSRRQARSRAVELLDLVSIPDAHRRIDDYPHNLSGGMRQRVMIAMAVACHPKLLIADEPTTALDVTMQAQVLDLLDDLRHRLGMAVLLITHDLGVVAQWADRIVGDVCRPHRRAGRHRAVLRRAAASLFARAAGRARRCRRRRALFAQSAERDPGQRRLGGGRDRLFLRAALPDRRARLPPRAAPLIAHGERAVACPRVGHDDGGRRARRLARLSP